MTVFEFPKDRIVGLLAWTLAPPVHSTELARGRVEVPDGASIDLQVWSVTSASRTEQGWQLSGDHSAVDVSFLTDLPADAISTLSVVRAAEHSVSAISHLAPGVRRFSMPYADMTDVVLPAVAALHLLTSLQTFGNNFTDDGVQVLAALTALEFLYLEEESLTADAFRFVRQLPRLRKLGLQDVQITDEELLALQTELPGVDVTR
jgi:hypothetical protein